MSDNLSEYHVKNGIVYIFTHNEFEDGAGHPDREKDEERITKHFQRLNFNVNKPFKNKTAEEVKSELGKIADVFQNSDNDCMIIFVITKYSIRERYLAKNGYYIEDENGYYTEDENGYYTEDDIINRFKNTAKPVILFIQATTTTTNNQTVNTLGPFSQNESGLPQEVNFYIVRSSIPFETKPGEYVFIHKLCEGLEGKKPLDVEVRNVLQSIKNEIEVNKRTLKYAKIEVHTPDVTSTMIHTLYLSQKIPSISESIPTYDKQTRNGYIYSIIYKFKGSNDEICGAEVNEEKIKQTFQILGFDFHQFQCNSVMDPKTIETLSLVNTIDIPDKELKRKLEKSIIQIKPVGGDLSKEDLENELKKEIDFSPYMCVIVYILTHGGYNQGTGKNVLSTSSETIDPMDIVHIMQSHKSLKGKPKIFIFEACRGDGASEEVNFETTSYNPKDIFSNNIVEYDDTLILYTSSNTKKSFIDPLYGTSVAQSFCEELAKRTSANSTASLLDVITATRNRVAKEKFKIKEKETGRLIDVKLIPVTVSTLTEDVWIKKQKCEKGKFLNEGA